MTDRVDALYDAITARARRAAGEVPDGPAPAPADPLGPLRPLLQSPPDAPPCAWPDGCDDPAYVRVITGSGTSDEADGYCGRHARRVHLDRPSIIVPLKDFS